MWVAGRPHSISAAKDCSVQRETPPSSFILVASFSLSLHHPRNFVVVCVDSNTSTRGIQFECKTRALRLPQTPSSVAFRLCSLFRGVVLYASSYCPLLVPRIAAGDDLLKILAKRNLQLSTFRVYEYGLRQSSSLQLTYTRIRCSLQSSKQSQRLDYSVRVRDCDKVGVLDFKFC